MDKIKRFKMSLFDDCPERCPNKLESSDLLTLVIIVLNNTAKTQFFVHSFVWISFFSMICVLSQFFSFFCYQKFVNFSCFLFVFQQISCSSISFIFFGLDDQTFFSHDDYLQPCFNTHEKKNIELNFVFYR